MEVHLRDLFSRFQQQFGTGPGLGPSHGTCVLKVDGAAPAFVKSLFRASAALFRSDPWKRLRPGHLFGVRVGKDADWSPGKRQPFACAQFVGGDGGDLAVHLFHSEQDALRVTAAMETRPVPSVEILRVVFLPEELLSPFNRRMVRSLSLEAAGPGSGLFPVIDVALFAPAGGVRFRNPSLEELRFLFAFLRAAALVHPLLRTSDELPAKRGRTPAFDPFIETVDVDWPPEISRGWSHVAVTVSHPASETYDEKRPSLSPTRYQDPSPEELPEMETKTTATGAPASQRNGLRQCALCEKEAQGDQSLCCGRCRAVLYCSSACQRQHWKESHRSICGLYKAMMEREEELAMNVFFFPCVLDHPCKWLDSVGLHHKGMWRRICSCYSHCLYGLLPTRSGGHGESWGSSGDGGFPPDAPFPSHLDGAPSLILLSGWPEYYSIRSLPMSSPAAAILSHPLSVYHAITALAINCKNRLAKGKEVVVHYLGPEMELDWLPAFAEIGHLLSGSGGAVEIFMIGPDVPSGHLAGAAAALGGGRVMVTFVRGFYQDQTSSLPAPDVVVALNCGIESSGDWRGALEAIKAQNAPAFFTDRSEMACVAGKQVLRAAGLHISHPVTPNPFRSPVKDRAPAHNLPCFSNGFIFGVNT